MKLILTIVIMLFALATIAASSSPPSSGDDLARPPSDCYVIRRIPTNGLWPRGVVMGGDGPYPQNQLFCGILVRVYTPNGIVSRGNYQTDNTRYYSEVTIRNYTYCNAAGDYCQQMFDFDMTPGYYAAQIRFLSRGIP